MAAPHPGFAKAAASIAARENVPPANARAILAAGAQKASAKAKAKNPRLLKVSGVKKGAPKKKAAAKAAPKKKAPVKRPAPRPAAPPMAPPMAPAPGALPGMMAPPMRRMGG